MKCGKAATEIKDIHICKICGQKMNSKECKIHMDITKHNEFGPLLGNNDQQLKGGVKK